MEYRTGKCSQCGAEYKVPASFLHNVARCKVCKGVVHLSPAGGAAPSSPRPPAPEREAAPPRPSAPRVTRPLAPAVEGAKKDLPPAPVPERPSRERELAVEAGAHPRTKEVAAERGLAAARSGPAVAARAHPAGPGVESTARPGKAKAVTLVAGVVLALALALGFLFRDRIFGTAQEPVLGAPSPTIDAPAQPPEQTAETDDAKAEPGER